jgi:ceramide glucosyltransferase
MSASLAIASVYVIQLWIKTGLSLRLRAREQAPAEVDFTRITVMQPITSGDETLRDTLAANLEELPGVTWIWIVDRTDLPARELCKALATANPSRRIRILQTDEPPAGTNPKLWKQAAALPLVQTDVVAIIDDDTRGKRSGLAQLVTGLDRGADIVTGLPCYVPAPGIWSGLIAEFVNSAAILTYLPAAACGEPRSINGMFYAVKTAYLREHGLFTTSGRAITDDLAIARNVRRMGGRIVQTTRPQFIRTSVTSMVHYRRLMHRWFVFTRILVQSETPAVRALLLLVYGLPPLFLFTLTVLAWAQPGEGVALLLAVLILRSATLATLNRIFTGAWRHAPLASVAIELLQTAFLVSAWINPVIWWRRRRIHVQRFDEFHYLAP